MTENQENCFFNKTHPKTVELYGLEKKEFRNVLLNSEPNTIFTISGNPLEKEEAERLKYVWSEKQINERNSYIIKLYEGMISSFEIMKRIGRLSERKNWAVFSSESEVMDVINKYYKNKEGYTMEAERKLLYSFIDLLDYGFKLAYNTIIYNSKKLKYSQLIKLCRVSQNFLNTRGEITGWFKPTPKTEKLHERYKGVVAYFKNKENIDSSEEGKNDMVRLFNELRELERKKFNLI